MLFIILRFTFNISDVYNIKIRYTAKTCGLVGLPQLQFNNPHVFVYALYNNMRVDFAHCKNMRVVFHP